MTGTALADSVAAAHRRHRPPAIGAALVDAGGATRVAVAGTRIRDGDVPVRDDDVWHIGSCAKAMTASLYARLVEDASARWGATVTGPGGGPAQGMGWARPAAGAGLAGVGFAQQGSNRRWVATALVSPARDRAALVTVNDGRTRMLHVTARLGTTLLAG